MATCLSYTCACGKRGGQDRKLSVHTVMARARHNGEWEWINTFSSFVSELVIWEGSEREKGREQEGARMRGKAGEKREGEGSEGTQEQRVGRVTADRNAGTPPPLQLTLSPSIPPPPGVEFEVIFKCSSYRFEPHSPFVFPWQSVVNSTLNSIYEIPRKLYVTKTIHSCRKAKWWALYISSHENMQIWNKKLFIPCRFTYNCTSSHTGREAAQGNHCMCAMTQSNSCTLVRTRELHRKRYRQELSIFLQSYTPRSTMQLFMAKAQNGDNTSTRNLMTGLMTHLQEQESNPKRDAKRNMNMTPAVVPDRCGILRRSAWGGRRDMCRSKGATCRLSHRKTRTGILHFTHSVRTQFKWTASFFLIVSSATRVDIHYICILSGTQDLLRQKDNTSFSAIFSFP